MLTYEIIRTGTSPIAEVNGELQYAKKTGNLPYKSAQAFEKFTLFTGKENDFMDAYRAGDIINLYNIRGELVKTYKNIPTIYAGKWDNYDTDDRRRNGLVNEVLRELDKYGATRIAFDYEGRTRHETASHVFANLMTKLGHAEERGLEFEIGYNYEFKITQTK